MPPEGNEEQIVDLSLVTTTRRSWGKRKNKNQNFNSKKSINRLPKLLLQVKAGNNSYNLKNGVG